MKKILAFCLLISLLIGLVGCGKKAHIVFPFAASDVTKIEVIYKDGESDAQKKTVNKETEIDSLYKSFSELSVQEKDCTSADTLGSVVFTFYLADETSYEINYLSFATKSGRLQSENAGFDYFTSGDLVGHFPLYLVCNIFVHSLQRSVLLGMPFQRTIRQDA